jgi:DNA repair protein SbcD/Mre11
MPDATFRFIHASDFHLEQPAVGLAELPDQLTELLMDAPYQAAKAVFDVAWNEDVDFLVLSGNILDCRLTGPRGPLFLIEQFERMAERNIRVYWAGGASDPSSRWPDAFVTPENVVRFSDKKVETITHYAEDGQPLANILGTAPSSGREVDVNRFPLRDPADALDEPLYRIAAACGRADPSELLKRNVDYWALGGRRQRSTPTIPPGLSSVVHWPGSSQGRRPEEVGPFGCSLVRVDGSSARISNLSCQAYEWSIERIALDEKSTRDDLFLTAAERIETLAQTPGRTVETLVTWEVEGSGPLLREIARHDVDGDQDRAVTGILRDLLDEGAKREPSIWSIGIRASAPDVLSGAYYKQQSILGDYLRTISHYQMNPGETIELESFMTGHPMAEELEDVFRLEPPSVREEVLREAALLGLDLLGGAESLV